MKVQINNNSLQLMTGDITKQQVDAIVNAANGTLLGGGGVDGAIHRAAGPHLLQECKQFREDVLKGDYLPTGEVALTKGYNLPATYVIHTVGPIWEGGNNNEELLLRHCYQNSLELAMDHSIKSIAFPSISTGVYRFPIELASKTALQTIVDFLKSNTFGDVLITLFSSEDMQVYKQSLEKMMAKEN